MLRSRFFGGLAAGGFVGLSGTRGAAAMQERSADERQPLMANAGEAYKAVRDFRAFGLRACLLVSYRPLATRSLNAREALEAAPRGDTPSDCLIVADSSPISQIRT